VGLANNIFGLIPIYIAVNSPFSIFLMRAYMVQIPDEFEDAARIDGAGPFQIFFRIIVPIARPALLTVGLVVGLAVWNEYLLATVFLSDPSHYTIVTSYYNFQTQFSRDWGLTSAAAIMMILPLLALFLSLQRRFVEGLTQGGIKG
jgi:raffinose/stachyose/melibiose transport system permease protein